MALWLRRFFLPLNPEPRFRNKDQEDCDHEEAQHQCYEYVAYETAFSLKGGLTEERESEAEGVENKEHKRGQDIEEAVQLEGEGTALNKVKQEEKSGPSH